jgi:putative oxidoreductase
MPNHRVSDIRGQSEIGRSVDRELGFLSRFAPLMMLFARAMLAAIFIAEGCDKIANYSGTGDYMRENGVDPRFLPLVIVTELGGGFLVLLGLKTRWAAIALCGFCLLTAIFIHWRADEMIEVQKNVAIAGGFLTLAISGPGAWSLDGWRAHGALLMASDNARAE